MKKVLIFSLNYFPYVGGAEVAIREITDRIPSEEFEFHLLAPRYDSNLPKEEKVGNVHVHRYGLARRGATIADQSKYPLKLNKYLYQATAAHKAAQLHKMHQFDAVWAMMAHASGIPASIFKKNHPEIPYLLTLQEGDPPQYIERLMGPVWSLFTQAFAVADYLQVISIPLLAWGKAMGFHGVAEVIPNGVDFEKFSTSPSKTEAQEMRQRLAIQEDEVTLITASRLVHKNAIDDVLRALPLLPEKVTFVVCGVGPLESDLKKLTQELSLSERVRFVGALDHNVLPYALHVSSIFIRPSRSEGMGNSFIEAMAAGIPVIATQEGGISDFLFDEKRNPDKKTTGWAVNANAPEEIAEAVLDIIARPQKVTEVVGNARACVHEKYDWDAIAKRMESVFDKMCLLPSRKS